jgi:cyclomaltodextrinase
MKPDLYLLGEIWHDASQWLLGDEYDSVMNYPLMSGIHDFFLDRGMEKEEFEYMVNRCYTMYMQQSNNVMFNLLDSHDTQRLMSRFDDLDLFYQQLAVLFTMPGSACIYYGTEIAMEGGFDPDCRRCMPWQELDSSENQEKIQIMQKLIAMRKQEAACKSLYFHFPNEYEKRRLVEYIKLDQDGNQLEVLLNCSEESVSVKEEGEVLFSRRFEQGVLKKNGTLIRRKK